MADTTIQSNQSFSVIPFATFTSALFTLLLFFIDEGLYSSGWMSDLGTWMAFFIYAGVFFLCQVLISQVLLKGWSVPVKAMLTIVLGLSLGLYISIGVIFN